MGWGVTRQQIQAILPLKMSEKEIIRFLHFHIGKNCLTKHGKGLIFSIQRGTAANPETALGGRSSHMAPIPNTSIMVQCTRLSYITSMVLFQRTFLGLLTSAIRESFFCFG